MTPTFSKPAAKLIPWPDARAPDDEFIGLDDCTHTEAEQTLVVPVKEPKP